MKATPIPTASREALDRRDHRQCVRCGSPRHHWHHRRTRSVRDEHTHHPGNGVSLCTTCHDWCHHNPGEAMALGLIVSRHEDNPCTLGFQMYYGGWVTVTCLGTTYNERTTADADTR